MIDVSESYKNANSYNGKYFSCEEDLKKFISSRFNSYGSQINCIEELELFDVVTGGKRYADLGVYFEHESKKVLIAIELKNIASIGKAKGSITASAIRQCNYYNQYTVINDKRVPYFCGNPISLSCFGPVNNGGAINSIDDDLVNSVFILSGALKVGALLIGKSDTLTITVSQQRVLSLGPNARWDKKEDCLYFPSTWDHFITGKEKQAGCKKNYREDVILRLFNTLPSGLEARK